MSLSGAKVTNQQKDFSKIRNEVNKEVFLPRHLKIMQPKNHWFLRASERGISVEDAFLVIDKVLRFYSGKLAKSVKTDYVLKHKDICVAVAVEPCHTRVIGHVDDGEPTVLVSPITVYRDSAKQGHRNWILTA